MMRLCCVALLGLAACTTTPLPPPVSSTLKSSAENQFKQSTATITSYRTNEEGKRRSFDGAVCSGSNSRVSFSGVVTEGRVSLPTYLKADRYAKRGEPPAITLRCSYNGQTVQIVWPPSNSVHNQTTRGATNCNGSTCHTASATKLTSRLSATLPWGYADVDVNFP